MHYVIIGAGPAGVIAAETLHKTDPQGEITLLGDEPEPPHLSLQFQDDVITGATSIGLTHHVGVLRGLIQSRVRLGAWKQQLLRDPSRVMEAYLAKNYSAQHRA